MFNIGCYKVLDSFSLLAMLLDQMAEIYQCKNTTSYPYEHFGLDQPRYQEVISNLNIEDFKSSLSNKLPIQEEVKFFKKDNRRKTSKNLTIEYLQNDVEILNCCMNEYVILSMKEFGRTLYTM